MSPCITCGRQRCWQAAALTYLVMTLRSRLMSILATASPATEPCRRQTRSALRGSSWTLPNVDLLPAGIHRSASPPPCPWERGAAVSHSAALIFMAFPGRAAQRPHNDPLPGCWLHFRRTVTASFTPKPLDRLTLTLRSLSGVFSCSRQTASPAVCYSGGLGVAVTRSVHSAPPSDDYAAHAHSGFRASLGKKKTAAIKEATIWYTMYPHVKTTETKSFTEIQIIAYTSVKLNHLWVIRNLTN